MRLCGGAPAGWLLLACLVRPGSGLGLLHPRGGKPTADEVAAAEKEARASVHFGPQLSKLFPGKPPVLVRSSPSREFL